MKKIVLVFAMLVSSVALAENVSGSVYGSNEVMRTAGVEVAEVVDIRRVTVQQQPNNMVGQYGLPALGGVLGGIVGNTIGDGTKRALATVLLTAGGAYAGQKVNEYSAKGDGIEFILKKDDGKYFAVTQPLDEQSNYIGIGDKVRLVQGAYLRVVKLGSGI